MLAHLGSSVRGVSLVLPMPSLAGYEAMLERQAERKHWIDLFGSAELQQDREVVLAAVQQHGNALMYASAELKKDREVVLAAVQQDGRALKHASAELRHDREVVLAAVQQHGYVLEHASANLQEDRELVLAAVQQNGEAIRYAADTLLADDAFVRDETAYDAPPLDESCKHSTKAAIAGRLRQLLEAEVSLSLQQT